MTQTKTRHVLPKEAVLSLNKYASSLEERDAYMAALRQVGWTLQSIADAVSLSRERVRQLIADVEEPYDGEVPLPPQKPVKPKRQYVEPKPETLARLLELAPVVKNVRANSPKYREEAEEFTALLWDTVKPVDDGGEGVPVYRIAKRLGVTHAAIRSRLRRYEYIKVDGEGLSDSYTPVLKENRAL